MVWQSPLQWRWRRASMGFVLIPMRLRRQGRPRNEPMMKASRCRWWGKRSTFGSGGVGFGGGELLIQVARQLNQPGRGKGRGRSAFCSVGGARPSGGDFAGACSGGPVQVTFDLETESGEVGEIRKLRRTPGAHAEVTRCAGGVDAMPAQLSFDVGRHSELWG